VTSHDQLGDTGRKTGFWLEEFAAHYYVFKDAGVEMTLASPKGGQPPLDPRSDDPDSQTEATRRFKKDNEAQVALANAAKLSTVSAADYDAVFYPGGLGPLWDLARRSAVVRIDRNHVFGGKASRRGLPCSRCAPSCKGARWLPRSCATNP
jgi:putative intracellular protease/amidase